MNRIFLLFVSLFIGVTTVPAFSQSMILIKNGNVYIGNETVTTDILVENETIRQIGNNLNPPGFQGRIIDASGKLILPGGIDPHVHLTGSWVDDFESGSKAALAGGITTLGNISYSGRGEGPLDVLNTTGGLVTSQAIADIMLHPVIRDPGQETIDQFPQLVENGITSIKIYMVSQSFDRNLAGYLTLFEEAAKQGIIVMLHCEDASLLARVAEKMNEEGKTSLRYYAESRPVITEVTSVQRAVAMSEIADAPIYIVHLSSGDALDVIVKSRDKGVTVYAETRPLYLHLTDEKFLGPDGGLYVGQPPLRTADDVSSLWAGIANGDITTMATDHAPWTKVQKMDPSQTITNFRAGVNNLQVMLPMLYSEGVVKGRISLRNFVEITSLNSAKIFGLYPKKGVIAVGSDADLVIWDTELSKSISGDDMYSNAGFSIYEGEEVTGWPQITIRRGEVVFENGEITGKPGSGILLKRQKSQKIK